MKKQLPTCRKRTALPVIVGAFYQKKNKKMSSVKETALPEIVGTAYKIQNAKNQTNTSKNPQTLCTNSSSLQ